MLLHQKLCVKKGSKIFIAETAHKQLVKMTKATDPVKLFSSLSDFC